MSELSNYKVLEQKIDKVEKVVDEIRTALIGSDLTNKQGIVHDIADHEKRITSLEKKADRVQAWLLGAGFVLGLLGYKLFDSFFSSLK